jgi:hypothetical protein
MLLATYWMDLIAIPLKTAGKVTYGLVQKRVNSFNSPEIIDH